MQFDRLKSKSVLLVEDEKVIRENIASMLRFFFKDVYTASDGYEGLDSYEKNLPDIIFTDLKMPNMGGFELIEELEKRSAKVYSIIVSAHTDTDLLINAIHNGVDRYLVKPLTEKELFETFDAYLAQLDKTEPKIIEIGSNVFFDLEQQSIMTPQGQSSLNKKEFLLLKLLSENREKSSTYEIIENRVWGSKSMSLAALRSVIRDLRKKIAPVNLENISGTGYKLS